MARFSKIPPLPLTTRFRAIRAFAANSLMSVRELRDFTEIERVATARVFLRKLQRVLNDEQVETKLAGLSK